jgi:hypothetical protein
MALMTVTPDRKPSEEEHFSVWHSSFAFKTVVDGCLVTKMKKTGRYCMIQTKLTHVCLAMRRLLE